MRAAYHENAPGNVYNITNDRPLTQKEMFDTIADAVGGIRPTRHIPYLPIYYGSIVTETVANLTRTKPLFTLHGAKMFGTDNRHSIDKTRRELGYLFTRHPLQFFTSSSFIIPHCGHSAIGFPPS